WPQSVRDARFLPLPRRSCLLVPFGHLSKVYPFIRLPTMYQLINSPCLPKSAIACCGLTPICWSEPSSSFCATGAIGERLSINASVLRSYVGFRFAPLALTYLSSHLTQARLLSR